MRIAAGATAITELWLRPPRSVEAATHRFGVRFQAANFPDVFDDIAGELRVRLATADTDGGSDRPMGGGGHTVAPLSPPIGIDDRELFPAPTVVPPDAQLAPSTQFRLRAGRVSEQAMLTVQNGSRIRERYEIAVLGLPEGLVHDHSG